MISVSVAPASKRPSSALSLWSWAFFDWANSPYTTLIITFVFSTYFTKAVAQDESQLWGVTQIISSILIVALSPIFGAIADVMGNRKPWLAGFTAMCVIGSGMLWFAVPTQSAVAAAMFWVIISNIGFEFGATFNSAMLPDIVPDDKVGRWSGWAWGLGYAGGLVAMAIAYLGFVAPEHPLFGISHEQMANVRVVGPICAIWFVLFSWPLFVFVPDKPSTGVKIGTAIKGGFGNLLTTFKHVGQYKNVARFMLARMFYNDALTTIFIFGGTYAAQQFNMPISKVLLFGGVLNITAGIGAASFAFLDDKLGSRKTIMISLVGLIVTAGAAVVVTDADYFMAAGAVLGIFVGPAQAASRTMLARLAPPELATEFFGLFAFTGKAISFIGPLMFTTLTAIFHSQRAGMCGVAVFLIAGLIMMFTVKEPARLLPAAMFENAG
ncbi:MAG: MFS transporter [Clostridia bacterium]|nr:MFS transporter [Deltaproteobacteria bacterium]